MSEMIERIEELLASAASHPTHCSDYRWQARAVIEAMREPTAAMIDAGTETEYPAGDLGADQVAAVLNGGWRAMIDAALV